MRRWRCSSLFTILLDEFAGVTACPRAASAGTTESADGTLVRANASYKSFVPIEVAMDPEEYKKRLRAEDRDHDPEGPQDRATAR